MAVLELTTIDFQVISTGNPKYLIIFDTSIWGSIANQPATIEIIPPNKITPVVSIFEKGKTNVFNTSNLLLSTIGCYENMPDGLYSITVKGPTSTNCKQRYFLKTDKLQLELYKLYASLGIDNSSDNIEKKKTIQDIDLLLRSAKANVVLGNNVEGVKRHSRAIQYLKKYNTCNKI